MKAIITKYHGPTDRRGSRVSATDTDRNRITIPYDDELRHDDAYAAAAIALCKKMGWKGKLIGGGTKTGMVFVFANSDAWEIK